MVRVPVVAAVVLRLINSMAAVLPVEQLLNANYRAVSKQINLQLNEDSFTLAQDIADAINRMGGMGTASALDSRTVQLLVPANNRESAL